MPLLTSAPVRACAWCGRVHVAGAWRPLRAALRLLGLDAGSDLGPVTHDICERCAADM
jgi:hypothetical protein